MPADLGMNGGSWGVAFLVAAATVAEMVAKACSSPQTVEINADKRASTLMKWVSIGLIEGIVFIAIAMAVDKKYRVPILLGGGLELVITWAQYAHAKKSGLENGGPTTEEYS